MRKMPWVMYLWPGLPQLWIWGKWTGLVTAVTAAAILDLLLLGSIGWSELIPENLRTVVWATGLTAWFLAAVWFGRRFRRELAGLCVDPETDAFGRALNYYLKGDYFQTERLLEAILRVNVRDVDARLMLATLMRRTGRLEDAAKQLDALVRFDGAAKWQLEIERERRQLAEAKLHRVQAVELAETTPRRPTAAPAHAA